jgi:hypothetical protein
MESHYRVETSILHQRPPQRCDLFCLDAIPVLRLVILRRIHERMIHSDVRITIHLYQKNDPPPESPNSFA